MADHPQSEFPDLALHHRKAGDWSSVQRLSGCTARAIPQYNSAEEQERTERLRRSGL
jgi:hypothetical protein